jgi:hypothetical protein
LGVITEPRAVVAVAARRSDGDAAGPREDSLLVVWVPPAVGVPVDLDSSLQAWIRREASSIFVSADEYCNIRRRESSRVIIY